MCGIAGFIDQKQKVPFDQWRTLLESMGRAIQHRGPDDAGTFTDVKAGVGFSHRRLSVVDLSAAGAQPMSSKTQRYVMVFNGEIYNHFELRARLPDVPWAGHSDTETLLAGFERWGIEKTIQEARGMFAIAVLDMQTNCVTLLRDRLGEKPLYYGWLDGIFFFASELRALEIHPHFSAEVDRESLSQLMRFMAVPAPRSIFKGVQKLSPGTMLTVQTDNPGCFSAKPYWELKQYFEQPTRFAGSDGEAILALENQLQETVRLQSIADVPLGAFLSGGIDSSVVVAMMQSVSEAPVRTFSIGVRDHAYNEAEQAKAIARHLGTDHTELYVEPENSIDVINKLVEIYDEPFADFSQIPTYLVSEMTREHVTVALSGDGGDELFGGYNRYFWARRAMQQPQMLRSSASSLLQMLSPKQWDRLYDVVSPLLPKGLKFRLPGDKAHKLADVLSHNTPEAVYRDLVSVWKRPDEVVLASSEPDDQLSGIWNTSASMEHCMMYLDAMRYMPDDILVKVDRAAMAVSLETRVPFLDHKVVEFAWSLPLHMKIRNGTGKWLLKQLLYRHVPSQLVDRPKMGFGIPLDDWLRGPLKSWASEILTDPSIEKDGYLNSRVIQQRWQEHLDGRRNWHFQLWVIIAFQNWLNHRK